MSKIAKFLRKLIGPKQPRTLHFKDQHPPDNDQLIFGMNIREAENLVKAGRSVTQARGDFIFDLHWPDGTPIHYFEKKNIITLDAGLHSARLFRDPTEPANGINMLAVGTGAVGPLLSPNAPDPRQRRLNAEIARKTFESTTYRDSSGVAVSRPTNIVDYSTVFGPSEANGPLNEMGVISTVSDNPLTLNQNPNTSPSSEAYDTTLDITPFDVQINYLTFSVITKPAGSVLRIVWRITH